MHDKRSEQEKTKDQQLFLDDQLPPGKAKPLDGKMPTTIGALPVQSSAPAVGGTKSASLRHCKSFNSKDSNLVSKASVKSYENSKISSFKSNGALSSCNGKVDAPPLTLENGGTAANLSRPKQCSNVTRSEKIKAPVNGISRNPSSNGVNVELQKKSNKETSPKPNITSRDGDKSASSKVSHKAKETFPKPALAHVKSLSLSLNVDPQKKLPPIKTSRTSAKSSSAKNTANLCAECKAEVEGAVCFIGNDGRVSACTSRNAVRLCKNLKCANNNPELVASLAAVSAAPKKYLVSRRHSLPARSSLPNGKNGKSVLDKMDAQAMNQNGILSPNRDALPQQEGDDHKLNGFDMEGEVGEDGASPEDHSEEVAEIDGIATASPYGGRSANGYQKMRRRSFNMIETQAPAEVVTLRKQMMQERKQAEEWMLDYAIEEVLQKLVPSKESKVKALVEAFESIMPNKEADAIAQDHQSEVPKTLSKISINA